jgi:hypothetical protein
MKNDLNLTPQQIDAICYRIGDWYLQWRDKIVNYDNRTHNLGVAKEQLKILICGDEECTTN